MSFIEAIERARTFLQRNGRVSLRALKREFDLDDEGLDELVKELVDVQQVATRDDKVLAWISRAAADVEAAAQRASPAGTQAFIGSDVADAE